MKKVAILHFAYPPNIGGVEELIREHAHILSELDFEVNLLIGAGDEPNKKIKTVVIPEFQSVSNFAPLLQEKILTKGIIDQEFEDLSEKIEKILEKNLAGIDIVIVHNMLSIVRNLPFVAGFKKYVEKNPGKKYIAWTHDHSYINEFQIKNLEIVAHSDYERKILTTPIDKVTYVIISETFKEPFIKLMNLPSDKVLVIPNGLNYYRFLEIDPAIVEIAEKINLHTAFPIILSPVNILDRKNLDYSINIIAHLRKTFPDIKFLISGNPSKHHSTVGYLEYLKELVSDLNLSTSVLFFCDFLHKSFTPQEIHDLYQISDAVFYFSKSENFGLPLIEAFASKTPIFVSDLQVFREIGGTLAEYIDYKTTTPEKAAEKIKKYFEDSKLIKASSLIREKFNLKLMLREKLLPIIK